MIVSLLFFKTPFFKTGYTNQAFPTEIADECRAILWKATQCDPGDWSLIAANSSGDTQLSQFNNPNNTHISLLAATQTHLYVGFDNGWAQGGMNTAGLAFDWVAGY